MTVSSALSHADGKALRADMPRPNDRDYSTLLEAIDSGRLEAVSG